jgi:hypothetical protein
VLIVAFGGVCVCVLEIGARISQWFDIGGLKLWALIDAYAGVRVLEYGVIIGAERLSL